MTQVYIRPARIPDDMPRLLEISPVTVKPESDWYLYPTLVAEMGDRVVGYTQFSVGPDMILHSKAIRVDGDYKGHGIGAMLMAAKVDIAKKAGCRAHMYPVATQGEQALKKILLKSGMHLCKDGPEWQLYMEHWD